MSSRKNMFTGLGFGEFYNNLIMIILDICQKDKTKTGGIMKIDDVIQRIRKNYKDIGSIEYQDITRALEKS